jgi:hypothetical protein
MFKPTFKTRISEYNTSNLQNLGASITPFIVNPQNITQTVLLSPSQLNNLGTTPILVLTGAGPNQYILLNSVITELLFNTGATPYNGGGLSAPTYAYGNSLFSVVGAGIAVSKQTILDTTSSISYSRTTGLTDNPITNILGLPIYMVSVDPGNFSNGTSNVKLIMNYGIFNYP